jgi:pheganomycin biosynthesis PGM1-like protein
LTGHLARPPYQQEPADNWAVRLERFDRMLVQHDMLRLRIACPSQEFSAAEMAFGVCRWLSGARGIWESLDVGGDGELAIVMLQAPRIGDGVLDYLFRLLPPNAQASTQRHALVELDDASDSHLSEKVLGHEPLLARLRQTIGLARERGHQVEGLSCYASSQRMALLADVLGLDLIDADPTLLRWGTKSGSRQLFRRAGVPHPPGTYQPDTSIAGLASTLNALTEHGHRSRWILKADAGFGSGHGNAVVDVTSPLTPASLARAIRPCSGQVSTDSFVDRVIPDGVIIEQLISPEPLGRMKYPSALGYLRRTQDGCVSTELLAVHEQILGAASDFDGCRFPADSRYRTLVADMASKVLRQLAALGVTGHAGIDFIVCLPARTGPIRIHATEINLRQTGTTHPHQTVRAVVPGDWDQGETLTDRNGGQVCYTGTDGIISPRYAGISSTQLIRALHRIPGLTFNPSKGTGLVPHLWPSLERCGKVGATCVARSADECDQLKDRFVALLEQLADGTPALPTFPDSVPRQRFLASLRR